MTVVAPAALTGSGRKFFIPIIAVIALLLSGCATRPQADVATATSEHPVTEFMLTFDDGPLPGHTDRVLDMLATLKTVDGTPVKAGFFLLGDAPERSWQRWLDYAPYEFWNRKGSIAKYPDIARRIQREGHIIGNHSTHHVWLHWPWQNSQKAIAAELTQWEALALPVLGEQDVRLFRPPYLLRTKNLLATTDQMGYQVVMGMSAGDAAPLLTLNMIKAKTSALLRDWDKPYPCVLVFHDIRPLTYKHLDEIVTNLQQQGFQLVHFDPARL
jgi:peptidoglycan/xylan/chitin deacetylase (PgdA/CDA1 family)